jgi:hypothetical protein
MGGRAGGGASGGMGSGVRASAPVAAAKTQSQAKAKVSIPSMPGKYKSATFSINGEEYSISHVPTGYGKQQKTNGRFTLRKPNGDYQDFNYGNFYGGYFSKGEAYKQLKSWVNKYYVK